LENNMIKATGSVLAVLMAAGLAVAGPAQARQHGVNERQGQQRERVAAGVRSGEVTRQESRVAHRDAQRIEHKEQAYRSDGHFSGAERREVHRDLDRHGRQIHHARNDHDGRGGQHAPGWHGGREWSHGRGGIDGAQQRQHEQIREGVRSGSLTPQEARRLGGEQRQIAALERRYRADGVLTRYERRDLNDELRDAGRHIYNQSYDADVSYRRQ